MMSQPYHCGCISPEGVTGAHVEPQGVERCVAGLAGDGNLIHATLQGLGHKAGAQRMSAVQVTYNSTVSAAAGNAARLAASHHAAKTRQSRW